MTAPRVRPWTSPWSVAGVVLALYAAWILSFLDNHHHLTELPMTGRHFLLQAHSSPVIDALPLSQDQYGYDGQFFYYIALDPTGARPYLDEPSYRYERILYPVLARLLALGRPDWIPATLVLINWLALGGGTLALAAWLRRRGITPWAAIVLGLFPGLFTSLQRDLSEPLGYALVALAIYLYDFVPPRSPLWAGAAFGLAALAREATIVFPLLYGLDLLLRDQHGALHLKPDWRARGMPVLLFGVLAIVPYLAWKAFLTVRLGAHNDIAAALTPIPFGGLWPYRYWQAPGVMEEVRSVVIPALICGAAAVWALARGRWRIEVLALLANVLLFVVFLGPASYIDYSSGARVTAGAVLAAVVALPVLVRTLASRGWFWVAATLWLALVPFALLIPTAHGLLHH